MHAAGSSGTLESWLEARLASVPRELAGAIRSLVNGALEEGQDGEEELVTVALDTLEAVAAGGGTRGSAIDLLASDALLTYAFEAAADPERGGSAARARRLARRIGPTGLIGARFDVPAEAG